MKKGGRILPWLIEGGIGAAVFAAVAASRGVLTETDRAAVLSGLCDAFFVPGIFMLCFGVLAYVAYGGAFDILSYGVHSLMVLFTPFRKPEKHQRYYEYKAMKEANRQKPTPRLLILGVVFMALALLCLAMYNRA